MLNQMILSRFNPATVRLEYEIEWMLEPGNFVSTPQRFDWNFWRVVEELVNEGVSTPQRFDWNAARIEYLEKRIPVSTPQRFDWNTVAI